MNIHTFMSQEAQIDAVISKIQSSVQKVLGSKSIVTIAVSGGKSPIQLFKKLSNTELPWENINITLVDERNVPSHSSDSNEYLVRNYLLKNYALKAKFTGILSSLNKKNDELGIDIVLLGMGEDGHTASIFPDCKELISAIDLNNKSAYMVTNPVSAKYERVSMTLASIINVPELLLCINGNIKFNVLKESIHNKAYPIHYVIKARTDLQVFYFD